MVLHDPLYAGVHRERVHVLISEDGDAVGHLWPHAVYPLQRLHASPVVQFAYRDGIDVAGLHPLGQLHEPAFPEAQPALRYASASVEDLLRLRERVPPAEVAAEMVAYRFHHLPDAGHVGVGREQIGREALPRLLAQDAQAGAAGREVGDVGIGFGDLRDYLVKVVVRPQVSENVRPALGPFDLDPPVVVAHADDLVPQHPLPPSVGLPPAVGLSASEGGVEGDIEIQEHAWGIRYDDNIVRVLRIEDTDSGIPALC